MKLQGKEGELLKLVEQAEPVPGTFPPVYMLDGVLIGYDKLEQVRVIAQEKDDPGEVTYRLKNPLGALWNSFAKFRSKLESKADDQVVLIKN